MKVFAAIFCVLVPSVLAQSEILYKFLKLNREHLNISHNCDNDLKIIDGDLDNRDIWALKLLDASGHPTSGFVWGNNYWLGSYQSCLQLKDPPKIYLALNNNRKSYENLTEVGSPIDLEYRMFYVNHDSKMQLDLDLYNKTILHIGLCFPSSCNNHDSTVMGREVFKKENFPPIFLVNEMWMISTKNLVVRKDFVKEPFVILMITISLIFLTLTISGTIFIKNLEKYRKDSSKFPPFLNNNTRNFPDNSLEKPTILENFLLCFSLNKNYNFIMSKDLGKNSIPTIHGMRSIGMVWIMAGHIYCYAYATIDNLAITFAKAQKIAFQPILSTAISVDTFFVLSGFLLAYLFFETQKRRPTKNFTITYLKSVINRYIRITPLLAIIMLVTVSLVIYQNDTSLFWPIENYESNCKRYWWRNLLFIQNLYPLKEMCMSWSWYVAVDFQMFVLSSLLLVVYVKNKKLCIFLSVLIAGLSALYSGYLGYKEQMGFSLDNQYKTMDLLYTKPYTRIGAYFVGCWTGWYLSKVNRELYLQKSILWFGWIFTLSLTTILVFGQHYQKPDALIGGLFSAFGRTAWAIAIAFIIVACSTGNGGFISSILHAKSFIPLSRISYATYLLNPVVVGLVVMSSKTAVHLDFSSLPILTMGFICATYLAAFLFMLLFENPCVMFIRKFIEK